MIESHWDGIASYCHPENKVSLGLVEGVNNKIRVLQRRAYGYRDEEYLKLKIVAAFLPPFTQKCSFSTHTNPRRPEKDGESPVGGIAQRDQEPPDAEPQETPHGGE